MLSIKNLTFSEFWKWTFSFKLVHGDCSETTPSTFSCGAVTGGEEAEMDCSYDRIWFGRFYFACSGMKQLLWCEWDAANRFDYKMERNMATLNCASERL
jgi:hypothetical protein